MDDTPAAAAPSAPDRIGPYRVVHVNGRGSIEIRCVARDMRRGRDVVLDVLPLVMSRRPEIVERLSHLADVVRQLRHPGLVRLIRFEVDSQRPDLAYFVWEHVPGRSLEELIAEHEVGLDFERVGGWAAQLAEAIDFLDDNGPGHGGVCPANVIIDEHDGARLGGAVIWREVRRLYAQVTGRPTADLAAMDPERERRRDVVGLASSVYLALRGTAALEADEARPQPITGLSAQLNMTLMEALDEATPTRFARAGDLVRALEGPPLLDGVAAPPRSRSPRGRRLAPLLTGVAASALTLSAVVWAWNLRPPRPTPALLVAAGSRAAALPALPTGAAVERASATTLARPEFQPRAIPAEVERLPAPAGPPPDVPEASLAAAAARAETARGRAAAVEAARRPGATALLLRADERIAQAEAHRRDGRRAEALEAFEEAAETSIEAVTADAMAATVWALGQSVHRDIGAIQRLDDGSLDAAARPAMMLITEGDEAYRRGAVAEANLAWSRAAQQLETLSSLAALAHGARLARGAWLAVASSATGPWHESLEAQVAATSADAERAEQLLGRGAYEHALAGWEGATRRREAVVAVQRDVECEIAELADAWTAMHGSSPLDEDDPDAEVRSRRAEALRLADEAREARDCGVLERARTGYAEATALWHEAVSRRAARTGRHGERLENSLGQRLVFVDTEAGRRADGSEPSTLAGEASSRGVWIAATEVTRGQFAAFVAATGYRTDAERRGWSHGLQPDGRWRRVNDLTWRDPGFAQSDDHPVVCVSYNDARAFCDWMSAQEGRAYRLPAEAEWEVACRAGSAKAFHWGDEPSAGAGFENAADARWAEQFEDAECFPWSDGCLYTCPVASLRENPWGLHDLHGNVQEWCHDIYDASGVVREAFVVSADAPDASPRVIRGGSFAAPPDRCRSDHRDASTPETSFATLGFRVVLESR